MYFINPQNHHQHRNFDVNDHIQNEHGKTIQMYGKTGRKKSFKWLEKHSKKKYSDGRKHANRQKKKVEKMVGKQS